ncbi:ferredoxin--NADP reductase [Endozoicomonas numazuensis]|uniref:ferredoxin--NADP(+) reductase n=1 Tax=Endozoicomonas numazuensis TaxID=1137799 RepID=A0A081NLD9_9GAMM|nr:ferredoxin--NADP reductase [Endozoicomonas numazuensis]KEQ19262.1 ferredoxin-NADP reductase [Endozoicomonas numazuensis]
MSNLIRETVTSVHHWNDTLFSFTTTRNQGLRFKNGHFTMIGLEIENKPLLRAYSIASANYEEEMEFFSIKVQDGPLTQHLQMLEVGDNVLVGTKPVGTLVSDNLLPGKNLYLLSTGTGLAPFMSIIKDFEIYEQFDHVILTHGVRYVSELAYQDRIEHELPENEYFGEMVKSQLKYYPTVTREAFRNEGRLTDLIESGKLFADLNLPEPNLEDDRFMLCGSPAMLKDLCRILEERGFKEARGGNPGHFVIERAFVEK